MTTINATLPRYETATQNTTLAQPAATTVDNGRNDGADLSDETNVPEQAPPGFDQGKWSNPEHNTPKYIVGRALASVQDELHAIPDEAGQKKFVESFLHTQVPAIEAAGGTVLQIRNEKMLLDMNDGKGPHWVDTIQDIGGKSAVQWCVEGNNEQPNVAQGGDLGGFPGFGSMGACSMPSSGGGFEDPSSDPDVRRAVQQIQSAGGYVYHAEKNRVLAEMNDGQGPRWMPVYRQQERDRNVQSMLSAMLG